MARYDEQGREVPDPTPVEVPLQFQVAESQEARLRRMILRELYQQTEGTEFETPEEADDFEIEDDPDQQLVTPYEFVDLEGEAPYDLDGEAGEPAPEPEPETGSPPDGEVPEEAPKEKAQPERGPEGR